MAWRKPAWLGGSNKAKPSGSGKPSTPKAQAESGSPTNEVRSSESDSTTLVTRSIKDGTRAKSKDATTSTCKLKKTGHIDVVVIGAGLSGLIAADELSRAGLNVKVLEASDRVGGRTLDMRLDDGNVVEMGGQWIGPGQDQILQLIKELGLETHNTYDQGLSIYRSTDGKVKSYKEMIPCGILPSLDLLMATRKINSLSKSVPAKTPCQAKNARYWDERSIGCWIDDAMWTSEAKQLFRMAIKAVYAEDSESISFLDLLATVAGAGGDIEQVLSDAQTTRIIQGPQAISERLAARLPEGVLELNSKVLNVHRADGDSTPDQQQAVYEVSTIEGQQYKAPVVIITPPRPLICQMDFQPPLPSGLIQYYRRQPMGSAIKFNVVYPSPFWRDAGLNGAMINADGMSPVQMTYDNSPADAKHGVIVAFVLGNNSRRFLHEYSDAESRKQVVLDFLVTLFGDEARNATQVLEMNWTLAPYATGGYGSFNPPGVLTSFEEDERDEMSKIGNLYFAGDATSEIWQGYMEGALLSGRRVATRIISTFEA
ncbi:related to Monoamine oxidase A [flavin-containing] [Sporisorium reilianum SRZ2]|uniref:Amine oxidase n=1 Tax=Sporisorium reilianum (strain SRZ2) TaxID=999809 RepID=E6ZSK1_SPORE|nr:related to Monoamine oxidase A [flavin-containing] [Sporisorium reilianum SRZ2]